MDNTQKTFQFRNHLGKNKWLKYNSFLTASNEQKSFIVQLSESNSRATYLT